MKANTPFILARRRKPVSGTSTRKSAVCIAPLLWPLVIMYHLSGFLKPFLFYPSCWTQVGFEDNNPILCQQFPFEENCHFVSIVGICVNFWNQFIFALQYIILLMSQTTEDVPKNVLNMTVPFSRAGEHERQRWIF